MDPPIPTRSVHQPKRHPLDRDTPDIEDKFATLFSPATPRATPNASPSMHASRNLPLPPPPSQSQSQSHMLLRRDGHSAADPDQAALLVPVSPAGDPLSDLTGVSGALPGGDEPGPGKVGDGSRRPDVRRQLMTSSSSSSSLAFFNTFTSEARRASELNRRGYLDELLLHEDDPLYWIKEDAGPVEPAEDEFGEFRTGEEVGEVEVGAPRTPPTQGSVASLVDVSFDIDDVDEKFFQDRKPTTSKTGDDTRPKYTSSPSLPTMQTISPAQTSPPAVISDLSLSAHSLLDFSDQPLLGTGHPDESHTTSSTSPSPSPNYSTLSNFSSRWMSSLLSSSPRPPEQIETPSARRSLDTIFASHTNNTLPIARSKSHRDSARDTPSSSSSLSSSLFDAPRSHSPTSVPMPIARRSHSHAEHHVVPGAVSISHRTPFAPHMHFVPPSGAPGFAGEDHAWDRGFSEGYDRERVERRSVVLRERNEGEGCVVVLDVGLADLIRPHLPPLARLPNSWGLVYSLDQHGISLKTLYDRSEKQGTKTSAVRGSLLAVKDAGDAIFGAWIGETLRLSKGAYYGSGDAFLWRFANGQFKAYKWTGKNDYVALCEPDFISFGGGDGQYGLYLDDSLSEGSSARCPTFDNEPLCSLGPKRGGAATFECVGLEVWRANEHRNYQHSAGLYPPGLLPIINRANGLLSAGQFNDAARAYSEAIEQSPNDYLLYYKRATAYFSLGRHSHALDDFDRVLSLTGNSFDNALLMKARIHVKDGRWGEGRAELERYLGKVGEDEGARGLLGEVAVGEGAARRAGQAMRAELWTVCVEGATEALRSASHSLEIRQMRADCSLAAGDIEGGVGDLTRITHLSSPSSGSLMRIFRLSYFFLPLQSPVSSPSAALNTIKQCLHLDPDSKPCLTAHRLVKKLDRSFAELDELLSKEDWRGVVNLVVGVGKDKDKAFARKFDEAMESHATREQTIGVEHPRVPFPDPKAMSPRKEFIVRAVCRAYIQLGDARNGGRWCDTLLGMPGMEEDEDGLVGKGESLLLKEEWEEAVRVLEKAFDASGRSSRDIHQRLQRAQNLLKQSKRKDYYKVLDVARDADDRTIKKAFRRAAMTAHPDKGGSEAKMATVNEAYEVLSNPELRRRFDNGEDPNDPMAQQGGHPFTGGFGQGSPFAQYFQQAGGPAGGFQFHFSHQRAH